jgi:hypothetical protein
MMHRCFVAADALRKFATVGTNPAQRLEAELIALREKLVRGQTA